MTVCGCIAKIRRLMVSEQLQTISPLLLAKNKEHVEGSICLDSLSRLKDILSDTTGQAQYSFSFEIDVNDICVIKTRIVANVILKCQRCLKPISINIEKNSILGIFSNSDELEALADNYEPLQLDEEVVSLDMLIEDELLLAIPIAPLHNDDECENSLYLANKNIKESPFSVLEKLKID